MNDTNLQTAVFNKLTKAQYEEKLNNNEINDNEFYMIVDANQMEFSNVESETGVTLKTIKIGTDIWKIPSTQNVSVDLSNYYTKSEVYNKDETYNRDEIDELVSSGGGGTTDLTGYATEEWVQEQGYLTEHQSLDGYAKLIDIPTIPTNVSAFNNDAGYLTEHQSLEGYAKTEDIPDVSGFAKTENVVTKEDFTEFIGAAPEALNTIHEIAAALEGQDDTITAIETTIGQKANSNDVYTKTEIDNKGYLTEHQSLEGYAKTEDIPDISNLATKDEIPSIEGLASETYVDNTVAAIEVPNIIYSETEPESPVEGMIWLSDTAASGGSTGGSSGGWLDFSTMERVDGGSGTTMMTSEITDIDLAPYIAEGAKALYARCTYISAQSGSKTMNSFPSDSGGGISPQWRLIPLNMPIDMYEVLNQQIGLNDNKIYGRCLLTVINNKLSVEFTNSSGSSTIYGSYCVYAVY